MIKINSKKGFVNTLIIFLVIAWLLFTGVKYVMWDYPMERDVWDNLNRAQTSADTQDMLDYVVEAKEGLAYRDQTAGHCALLFKKPSNDLAAQYKIIENIVSRISDANSFQKTSVQYQTALDDIRGTIREVPRMDCWIWHFD